MAVTVTSTTTAYTPYFKKKSELRKRLSKDLILYSKCMGIPPEEIPRLLTSKKEYSKFFGTDMNDMIDKDELGRVDGNFE